MSPRRLLVYALGGGFCHLNRALALSRAAMKRGYTVDVLSNTYAAQLFDFQNAAVFDQAADSPARITINAFSPHAPRDEVEKSITRIVRKLDYDVLIVDTFPRGLIGELADILPTLNRPKVLVHRDLNPRYIAQYDLQNFVRCYDSILSPGENGPLSRLPTSQSTAPWLICDSNELLSRREAADALRFDADDAKPVIAVLSNGKPNEQASHVSSASLLHEQLGDRAVVRLVSLDQQIVQAHANIGVRDCPFFDSTPESTWSSGPAATIQ